MKKITPLLMREYEDAFTKLKSSHEDMEECRLFGELFSLSLDPDAFRKKYSRPLAGLACVQVPLELFDAFGFHPYRLRCGSTGLHGTVQGLPALTCPAVKSCLGHFCLGGTLEKATELLVIPTTCDWILNIPHNTEIKKGSLHIMELPHVKNSERASERWLEEVYALKKLLENKTGKSLSAKTLYSSIRKYAEAWGLLNELIDLRRERKLSAFAFTLAANAFGLEDVSVWNQNARGLLKSINRTALDGRPAVFLAGSPISFPNFKILHLLDEAGLFVAADDLCTSERVLAGLPVTDDRSEHGMLSALAEKYHKACHCPTFVRDERHIMNIMDVMRKCDIRGMVYHVLKGCHPYDSESFLFEKVIKKNGFHFIRLETDYSREDEKNILVRLEAFNDLF